MSINSKRYFIVIERDQESKNNLVFRVNFFYLKKYKKRGSSFSYVNDPFFRGIVTFGQDFKNKMRPLNFTKIEKDGSITPINPRLFKKFLLSESNKFIAFSNQSSLENLSPIYEMLTNLQFEADRIKNLTFCHSCFTNQKFTILNYNSQIQSLNNRIICTDCAYDIIIKEAKLRGIIPKDKISPKLKNFFTHMILKFRDIKKVVVAFQADFNPTINKEITLYDVEKKPDINKKYLNQKIEDLAIPKELKKIYHQNGLTTLLPIQAISIENELLAGVNQLIMAPTSGGKTLVGEIAGISRVLKEKPLKMLYLVPIVALANIRTEEFKRKYKSLKLKIVKKIGESLFEKRSDINQEDIKNADVIVATYEAIDHILRSGNKAIIGEIGTIIVDEIQTLIDPERGFLLDGFIARLKVLYKEAQFLYLSATLGEPRLLAERLNSKLLMYNNRPVPIERHLILCFDEAHKHKQISKLVKVAFNKSSDHGFKGQSIIFTNTRKKCEIISSNLQQKGLNISAYHSGLTNEERKIIEEKFISQQIAGVVATAALAAGVDLPASQVIFESLAMGIKWLTVAEFEQMLGRAGRLKKHNRGYAYLLVEPGRVYSPRMEETEENLAIRLLNGKIKDYELPPNNSKSITELLSFVSMFNRGAKKEEIETFFDLLINNNYDLGVMLKKLNQQKLFRITENFTYKPTRLGQAIAKSFLSVDQCLEIVSLLRNKEKSVREIALNLKPLKNVYLSKGIVADLAKNVNMKYLSNNLFSASVLSLMNAEHIRKRKTFSREFIDFISKWVSDIFNCNCKDSPYCDCGRFNLEKMLLNLRVEHNLTIDEICSYFDVEYRIIIFKGDIIDYLENLIYTLESIKNIAEGITNIDSTTRAEIDKIPKLIDKIKY